MQVPVFWGKCLCCILIFGHFLKTFSRLLIRICRKQIIIKPEHNLQRAK